MGVPQGTILGPLLFILYVNDLLTLLPSKALLSYADDTAILVSEKDWTTTIDTINQYLHLAALWFIRNRLTLNLEKTVFIPFGNYSDSIPENVVVKINDSQVRRVDESKYLGVIFDKNMRWNGHIEYIIKKTRYLQFIIRKLNKIMNAKTLIMIYFALFHSVTNYGIIA